MDLDLPLIISASLQSLCVLATLAILLFPVHTGELRLWRRFGIGRLRRLLTKRLRRSQPYSTEHTETIARSNIRWHLVLTCALLIQTLLAAMSQLPMFHMVGIFFSVPVVAWLLGSIVQRHKIALIQELRRRKA